MIYGVYSVKDIKIDEFMPGLNLHSFEEQAVRDFTLLINKTEAFKPFASDFALYYMGTLDTKVGFTPTVDPKLVVAGSSVLWKSSDDALDFYE